MQDIVTAFKSMRKLELTLSLGAITLPLLALAFVIFRAALGNLSNNTLPNLTPHFPFQLISLGLMAGAIACSALLWVKWTARTKTEQFAQTENEARAHHFAAEILRELQDEVYVYDTDTLEILYANAAACARCDWDYSDITGKRITDSSVRFNTALFRKYARPLLSGELQVATIETTHEKGPVEINTRLSHAPDGRPVFLSVLRDRSERQRLETAKMDSFSEICHELRTPLTSIKGSVGLLETGKLGALTPEADRMLDIVSRNTSHLISIVNDILDLQKIAANRLEIPRSPLDLVDFVKDAVSANRGYGAEHDVTLGITDLPISARVNGNADRLMQVMANLLSNAIKHSPAGEEVQVGILDLGDSWRVSVSDSGPGITPANGSKIFKSFAQITPEDGTIRVGTGLGLAIAKKIVKKHDGEISFSSKIGQGSEFYFDLPKLGSVQTPDDADSVKNTV